MRVIAGLYRGRRLKAVPNMKTRPTTDKVKENMFNILSPYLVAKNALDLFAGSGALSIEAVSRGVEFATMVERQGIAIKTIKANIATTKQPEKFAVIHGDCWKVLPRFAHAQKQFDLILLDPPYKQQKIVELLTKLSELSLVCDNAIVVCETDHNAGLPDEFDGYQRFRHVSYGISELSFYRFRKEQ